jgi:hypothetical protein
MRRNASSDDWHQADLAKMSDCFIALGSGPSPCSQPMFHAVQHRKLQFTGLLTFFVHAKSGTGHSRSALLTSTESGGRDAARLRGHDCGDRIERSRFAIQHERQSVIGLGGLKSYGGLPCCWRDDRTIGSPPWLAQQTGSITGSAGGSTRPMSSAPTYGLQRIALVDQE